jgi:hypothetical protein
LKLLGVLLALGRACSTFCSTELRRMLLNTVLLFAVTLPSGLP